MVRQGDDGYRIPSPAEDDWERQRAARRAEARRRLRVLTPRWSPASGSRSPRTRFSTSSRSRPASTSTAARSSTGDIDVHLTLAEPGELEAAVEEARRRSQTEQSAIFWVAALERRRSTARRSSSSARRRSSAARSAARRPRTRRRSSPRRSAASGGTRTSSAGCSARRCSTGTVFFRGNDRSPDASATDVGRAAGQVLGSRAAGGLRPLRGGGRASREEGLRRAARPPRTCRASRRSSPISASFASEGGQTVLNTESGPLAEVLARIEDRDELRRDAERPLALRRLREGAVRLGVRRRPAVRARAPARREDPGRRARAQLIESAVTPEAQNTFTNNNLFRAGDVPAEEGPRLPAGRRGVRVLQGHVRRDGQRARAGRRRARDPRAGRAVTRPMCAKRTRRSCTNGLPGADVLAEALDQMAVDPHEPGRPGDPHLQRRRTRI